MQDQFETWAASKTPAKLIKSNVDSTHRDAAIRAFLQAGVSTAIPMSRTTNFDLEDFISERL